MKISTLFSPPLLSKGSRQVWRRNFLQLKKNWLVTVFWISLEPLINLLAIGIGLGSYVNNINGSTYLDFYMPGLLCTTGMLVAFFESTYGSYTKVIYQKTYTMITLSPVDLQEIFHGEALWSSCKAMLGVFGLALVSWMMGVLEFQKFLMTLPMLFLVCLFFSCLGLFISSIAKHYDYFTIFISGLIVPMSLICGTYFPLEHLPSAVRYTTYLAPLTHMVYAVRHIFNNDWNWFLLGQTVGILLGSFAFLNLAIQKFKVRLE